MVVMNRTLGLPQQSLDDEAQLLISDEVYLDAVREIVRRLSVSELKRHLAWLFVQTHGVVADPGRLLLALFGEKSRARQERPHVLCFPDRVQLQAPSHGRGQRYALHGQGTPRHQRPARGRSQGTFPRL
ncbi:hypothetical protein MRX96_037063 [Rhipicephalus microplus]